MYLYRKIKNGILLTAAFCALYSCDDIVEVDPISTINDFYNTPQQIEQAIGGVYDASQTAYRTLIFESGELRSDNVAPRNNNIQPSRLSIHNNKIESGNGLTDWFNLYVLIDRANRIINEGSNIQGVDSNILAEAYALRAKAYFDVARVWGQGPLKLKRIEVASDAFLPARDKNVLLSQAVADMNQAESLFTNNTLSLNRFSLPSVYCLQAEVYMYQRNNVLAKEALTKFFNTNRTSLVTSAQEWQDLFINQRFDRRFYPQGTGTGKVQQGSELILSIVYDGQQNSSGVAPSFTAGAKITVIEQSLEERWRELFPVDSRTAVTEWEELYPGFVPLHMIGQGDSQRPLYGDWRYYASREGAHFVQPLTGAQGGSRVGDAKMSKFIKNRGNARQDATNIPLYRHADMVLLLAEAEAKLNNNSRALELVNEIRTARQLPLATDELIGDANTLEENVEAILFERQMELLGEGKRFWDLERNDLLQTVLLPNINSRLDDGETLNSLPKYYPVNENVKIRNTNLGATDLNATSTSEDTTITENTNN